ncbi:flagellar protein FliO [mine drainage metagenome]|uniref:Flagellar protein FliO n=1 Tax=mine drainage metagenome TaxID=410659 RepID=A0A1J5NY15_9ZZZZ
MSSAWVSIFFLVLVLAMIPLALKWLQRRLGTTVASAAGGTKVVSAIAVGPHQRVVTVEVGPAHARVWLTLGVTTQSISCLHTAPVPSGGTGKLPETREPSLFTLSGSGS